MEVLGITPDIVNAVVEFDNGCVANLTASRVSLTNERVTKFYQRDAHIIIDYYKQKTSLYKLKTNGKTEIYSEELVIDKENPIKRELTEFALAILEDSIPNVGILDGAKMLEAAFRVAEKNQKKLLR